MSRSVTLQLVDVDQPTERCVVLEASSEVEVSAELLALWRTGASKHVVMDGNFVTFGTVGEGCGRLTYEVVSEPADPPPTHFGPRVELERGRSTGLMRFVREEVPDASAH